MPPIDVARDKDPLQECRKTAAAAQDTFRAVAEEYLEREGRKLRTGMRRVYDRYEYYAEKQQALAALARLIERIINHEDNVLSLRTAAAGVA